MDIHAVYPSLHDGSDVASTVFPSQGLRWEQSRLISSGLNVGYMSSPLHLDLFDWIPVGHMSAHGSSELSTTTDAQTPPPPTPDSGDQHMQSEQQLSKPPYDYKTLVTIALESASGAGGMTICGIYEYILANFAYYRSTRAPPTWRSRIRNVLTVNDCFKRIPDPKGGRKGKWVLQRTESDSGSDRHSSGLKSPLTIRTDKNSKTMARSLSNLALTPTSIADISDSESTTTLSLTDLRFSFEDDDIQAGDQREQEKLATTTTYFRPMSQPSAHSTYTQSTMSTPSLMFTPVEGGRALSAASLEMVDQLAAELKKECSMLTKARTDVRVLY